MFEKDEVVIKVLVGGGFKTAVIAKVQKVAKGNVTLVGNESQSWYAKNGMEINPLIPGFYSELIHLDGDEEDHIRLDTL